MKTTPPDKIAMIKFVREEGGGGGGGIGAPAASTNFFTEEIWPTGSPSSLNRLSMKLLLLTKSSTFSARSADADAESSVTVTRNLYVSTFSTTTSGA